MKRAASRGARPDDLLERGPAAYAAELLAWNLLLGLALILAAAVLGESGLQRRVKRGLYVTGLCCIAGIVGPVVGNMRLQLVGVLGYAGFLPFVCLMLAQLFRERSA